MYTGVTSLPNLYIRNIIPDDVSIALVGTWPYRGGAVLILRVALAALFHKFVASEVADEHQEVISYIKDKARRVRFSALLVIFIFLVRVLHGFGRVLRGFEVGLRSFEIGLRSFQLLPLPLSGKL
jgi:hypothetical protein